MEWVVEEGIENVNCDLVINCRDRKNMALGGNLTHVESGWDNGCGGCYLVFLEREGAKSN